MLRRLGYFLSILLQRVQLRVVRRRLESVEDADPIALRRWRRQARETITLMRRLEREADTRLRAAPVAPVTQISAPSDATMAFRPDSFLRPLTPNGFARPASGTALGGGITLHHDITGPEMIVRQVRNREGDAPYGITLEAFDLAGSFLSFAVALPREEAPRTRREDLIRVSYNLEMDRPVEIFARLNLRHGPNVEQIVRELDLSGRDKYVEFDLFYTQYDPARGRDIWLDLIFQTPTLNVIRLRDLTVVRRPRMSL